VPVVVLALAVAATRNEKPLAAVRIFGGTT
jgi:hypothetical protein